MKKKIVNGIRYNTETAELIAKWSNSYYSSDFKYCEESLYKTKKGSWFISGEGGPMSKYAVSAGNNSYGGGSDIRPLTPEEARQWLEDTEHFNELENHFAEQLVDA